MSSKIKILNATLTELATIAVANSAVRAEKINSDNLLSFTIRVKSGYGDYIADDSVFQLDGDYFDLAYCKKEQQGDGKLMISVEAEHVSYRLNNATYNVETFTHIGTPSAILTAILSGTGFSVGTMDFVTPVTFSLQEAASRRALLMQFAAYVGGELEFDGFTISLLAQRGSATPKVLNVGKDLTVISKAIDKRKLDESGNPTVSYTCGVYKGASLNLGDVVTLDYDALGISTSLRVVSKSYDPYNPNNVSVEIGNYVNSLEDDLYRIETDMVAKGETYYGARISADNGFESIRSDKKARTVMNADLFAMQKGDGAGTYENVLYFDPAEETYVFKGQLSADIISAISALITPNLYTEKATIAELTVDQLDTSDKVQKYLNTDATNDEFQRIYDQYQDFIAAETDGLEANKIQATNRDGEPLYWTDETHQAASATVTAFPVYTYTYTEAVKMRLGFTWDAEQEVNVPTIILGGGTDPEQPTYGKGYIKKGVYGLRLEYITQTGATHYIEIGENGILLNGTEQLSALTFYSNGFSATYDDSTVEYRWTKDVNGYITKLTNVDTSEEVTVTWSGGAL